MQQTLVIIGAGMGGMAAGIYGQLNGYATQIFEQHTVPGGQCAAWKRKGYTFDGCIHHLFGCNPSSKIYNLWQELGVMPRELVQIQECVSVMSTAGTLFYDYYDPDRLEHHLNDLAPHDTPVIRDYIKAIRIIAQNDLWGEIMLGSIGGVLKMTPGLLALLKWFKPTMQQFAGRFSNPFLRQAFPLLVYSMPEAPLFVHLARHGYGAMQSIAWPTGGSLKFAQSMAKRYTDLGGQIHYNQTVKRILTEHDKAVGIQLADGSKQDGAIVISNADGRKTILEMLQGQYLTERIKGYCADPDDETPWAVHVFLGVNRNLSQEPSSLVMLLDQPVTIAGHEHHSLEMQIYGFDPTMAPPGKGVIKVELVSGYAYWKALAADHQRYEDEKQHVAEQVIALVERRFPGITHQIEMIDVPTLLTWESYMGGTHGFVNQPKKKMNIMGSMFGRSATYTLPHLSNFYFVGNWATSTGALFSNALSGRNVIQKLCQQSGKRFSTVA